jgi:hypothetical protein
MKQNLNVTFICSDLLLYILEEFWQWEQILNSVEFRSLLTFFRIFMKLSINLFFKLQEKVFAARKLLLIYKVYTYFINRLLGMEMYILKN